MSINSDELNFLVYRYLQESGYVHSAFTFAYESLVGRADLATADIPPGALINFLQKGLQYVEIEKELEQGTGKLVNGLSLLSASRDGSDAMAGSGAGNTTGSGGAAGSGAGSDPMDTSGDSSSRNAQTRGGAGGTTLGLAGQAKGGAAAGDGAWVAKEDVTELKGHKMEVQVCAWNPKADVIATGSADSTARLWSIPRGASGLPAGNLASKSPVVLRHASMENGTPELKDVSSLDWRPDGQQLASGSYDGTGRIWDVKGDLVQTLSRHKGTIFSIRWNPSGTYLLSGSVDRTAVVWDASSGTVLQVFENHKEPVLDIAWRNNETFATCSTDKMIYLCEVGKQEPLTQFSGHNHEVNSIQWNHNAELLLSCSDDFTARLWKPDQTSPLRTFHEHTAAIHHVKWSPTQRSLFATASDDATVKTWDAETGKCISTFADHTKAVYNLAFSPNGEYLATGSLDHTLRIWSVKDGKCIRKFKGDGGINEVAWNHTGDKVAACHMKPSKSLFIIDFRK
ncbi:F-box-like/WD repeat-containing protein TBL1X [Hondaea fermentalgiana]|uniref:F-box-like/WD repeat-containing protein TBL1X n=1 Tax=Hondaea fermentalgiana TaxID=2315210 RepID=A0A2R5GR18_9STRA|nr:F-box-like/WD repeat-containing protein TBL1X [Hondaea fermentalgiana]|eukprot:GBG30801.1 F-box-like/WD repeat-containing protein TBL1X [Hondaea fermentalgiana]